MRELEQQTHEVLEGKPVTCEIFQWQYAFNLFSTIQRFFQMDISYNEEEMKLVKETRKIWNDKDVKVTATCIQVPITLAHADSVNLEFENPLGKWEWQIGKANDPVDLAFCDYLGNCIKATCDGRLVLQKAVVISVSLCSEGLPQR